MAAGEVNHPVAERGIQCLIGAGGTGSSRIHGGRLPRVFFLRYHGYAKFFPLWALARYRNLKNSSESSARLGM
jgi:squalene-hopene/tetraprenyl-beta-curcumene cyclase